MELKAIDPSNEEYANVRERLRTDVENRIDTWDLLYKCLDDSAKSYFCNQFQFAANSLIALQRAFIHVMREYPEEGDCIVIRTKMFDVLVFRPDITGFDSVAAARELAATALESLVGVLETVSKIAESVKGEEESEPQAPVSMPGRTLH